MGKYDKFLEARLSAGRWALGSDLSLALITKFKVEPENARKIVQRAADQGVIVSSKPLSFGKGQFLYLRKDQFFGRIMVREVAAKHRKPLYRLLELLERTMVVSFYEGLKITSSTEEKTSTKISLLVDMLDDLEKLKLVATRKDRRGIHYILLRQGGDLQSTESTYEALMEVHFQSMQLDAMFIPDVLRWLRSLNLVGLGAAYRNVSAPATGVKHNNILWDAFAYSKTTGINPFVAAQADSIAKQTLVPLDVVISRKYLQVDLDAYLARIQININSAKMAGRKVMPVVVYQEIDEMTLNSMKKLGFLSLDINILFGRNFTEIIDKVRDMYSGFHEVDLGNTVEQALQLIDQSGHSDQLKSLRGALFEALLAPVVAHFYPNAQLLQGKKLTDPTSGKSREFDLVIISSHPKEVMLVELKGYAGKSLIPVGTAEDKDTLRYFFRGSVPIAQNYYKGDKSLEHHRVSAAYITSGRYHEDAGKFIRKVGSSTLRPSRLEMFYDGPLLEKLLNENGFEHQAKIIKQFYLDGRG
ncbi:hypothetical protein LPB86_15645 [Pedobacter sp. MC2016-14]|uniref:hypothetical protein n=1 Tax=Pedobacter sp. MC2016-14 TaxID=2897327 RepID=UPI001E3A3BD2|nr:hypothetical protein [Pedobacter sp. MC2016-14]MCD0489675.1 hypothetical protein [Pedobacter sp. MC2016-14]